MPDTRVFEESQAADDAPDTGRRRRVVRVAWVAALACSPVALIAVTVTVLSSNDEPEGVATVDEAELVDQKGGWRELAPGPADGRTFPSVVWSGEEILVWGGEGETEADTFSSGAAYDPATDTWRAIADAPIPPRGSHVAVWMDGEMFVCCGGVDPGSPNAAYDPVADSWRLLAGQSELQSIRDAVGAWTGREVIVTGGPLAAAFTYDPVTDQWGGAQAQAPVTFAFRDDTFWTGSELVVVPHTSTGQPVAFDPVAGSWRGVPTGPVAAPTGVWTGEGLLTWGEDPSLPAGAPETAVGFMANGLSDVVVGPMAPAPLDPVAPWDGVGGSYTSVWDEARQRMILYTGAFGGDAEHDNDLTTGETQVLTYYPATDTWERLPSVPTQQYHPTMLLAGDLLVIGSGPFYALDLTTAVGEPVDSPATISPAPVTGPPTGGPPYLHLGEAVPDLPAFEPTTDIEQAIVDAVHQAFGGPYNAPDAAGYEDAEELQDAFDRGVEMYPEHAEGISSIVWDVVILSDTEAQAVFDIVDDGRAVTATTTGRIVLIDGDWQVSRDTLCELMTRGGIPCP